MSSYHKSHRKSSHIRKNTNTKVKDHIMRPVYDRDDKIIGYISVPISEWAKELRI